MTRQKTLIIAALLVLTGTGVYEGRQVSCLHREGRAIEQQQAPLREQIQRLRQEREEAASRLALLAEENNRWQANSNELFKLRSEVVGLRQDAEQLNALRRLAGADPQAAGTVGWLDRVQRLKLWLAQNPEARIPEMASLTEQDWLGVTLPPLELDSEKHYRGALSRLRVRAEAHYLEPMHEAIMDYAKAHAGKWPTDLAQIKPFLHTPIEDAILQRYEIAPPDTLPMLNPISGWVLTEKAPVDREYDHRFMIGSESCDMIPFKASETFKTLTPAIQAYFAANNGRMPEDADPAKFAPYVRTAEEQAALASATKEYESAPSGMRAWTLKLLKNLKPK